jgi:hypothetical protein
VKDGPRAGQRGPLSGRGGDVGMLLPLPCAARGGGSVRSLRLVVGGPRRGTGDAAGDLMARVGDLGRGAGGGRVKVELLYFDGCPGHRKAERALRSALSGSGLRAEAERLSFPGSPTVRVDGQDLFPEGLGPKTSWHLSCRIYRTPKGPNDHPTAEMIRDLHQPAEDPPDARLEQQGARAGEADRPPLDGVRGRDPCPSRRAGGARDLRGDVGGTPRPEGRDQGHSNDPTQRRCPPLRFHRSPLHLRLRRGREIGGFGRVRGSRKEAGGFSKPKEGSDHRLATTLYRLEASLSGREGGETEVYGTPALSSR